MCFIAFLSEEPQGDSQDRTDSVGKAVGANAVSVAWDLSPDHRFGDRAPAVSRQRLRSNRLMPVCCPFCLARQSLGQKGTC